MSIEREINVLIYRLMPNETIDRLTPLLTDKQQTHLQGISRHKTRINYAASRVLLNRALSTFLEVDPIHIDIQRTPEGKPFVGWPESSPWRFNYSHTEGACALVIAKHVEVGIDVEWRGRKNNYIEIAKEFFHNTEYIKLLSISPPKQQKIYFYKLWTLKEAYLKAFGVGLAGALNSFSFDIDNTLRTRLVSHTPLSLVNNFCYGGYALLPGQHTCSFIIHSDEKIITKLRTYSVNISNPSLKEANSLKAELTPIDLQ